MLKDGFKGVSQAPKVSTLKNESNRHKSRFHAAIFFIKKGVTSFES